jgi:CheY-like chemotaxis protein
MSYPTSRQKMTILVVGGDHVRRRFAGILLGRGYEVVEAESGETAIDLALSLLPEVVLMSIVLPQLNGLETAARLRTLSKSPGVSIILLGCVAPIGLGDEPLASLIDGYLSIDASSDELLACVARCTNH